MSKRLSKKSSLRLVEISRRKGLESPHTGHLLGMKGGVVIFSPLDDGLSLDGVTVFRRDQVLSVKSRFQSKNFHSEILRGEVPAAVTRFFESIDSGAGLVSVLQQCSRKKILVALHPEQADPDICYVGFVETVDRTFIILNSITSYGVEVVAHQKIKLNSISKIEVGTRYLRALSRYIKYCRKI